MKKKTRYTNAPKEIAEAIEAGIRVPDFLPSPEELKEDKITNIQTGVAGEYFVAAELSRRGYLASITLKNTRGIDILVSNAEATKTIGIQVKTTQINKKAWMLNYKAENYYADNLFYVFVNLNGIGKLPEYFIVPSKIVSDYITKSHKDWLNTPGKKGQKHNDSTMRKFEDKYNRYLNRWELLKL